MPDKEHRILRRRLAEHQANMAATLAGIKELAEAARAPEPAMLSGRHDSPGRWRVALAQTQAHVIEPGDALGQ